MGRHKKKLPKNEKIKASEGISIEKQKTAKVMALSCYDKVRKPTFALEHYMRSLD